MNSQAVIGLGFGDEGKGTFTAYLCSQAENPIVVRYSGGHQAGHTVVTKDNHHIFSSFGSGTLQNVPTYWSQYCTFYPTAFLNELDVLNKKGITPKIFVNNKCPITTLYDLYANQCDNNNLTHGSCGVGFGATIAREENHYSLLFEDLFYNSVLKIKLEAIKEYYKMKGPFNDFLEDCKQAINIAIPTGNMPTGYDTYIYEGSQGLLLDKDIGFFPNVTRSNTGLKNIYPTYCMPEVFLVTRAYQTRHGNGPMTNENISHNILTNPNETNQEHKYQGKFRRSLLDLDLIEYAIKKDNYLNDETVNKSLVITCLDHIENDYRFTHEGEIVVSGDKNRFVEKIGYRLDIKSIYISESEYFNDIIKYVI